MTIDQYLQIASKETLKLTPEHYSLVKRTALYLKTRLPANIEVEDLMQSGLEGLMQASSSYDDTRGVTFDQFARTRIRGAMLDEVRRLSPATRTTINIKREQNAAIAHLSNHLGRNPTSAEVAVYLGKDIETYEKERLIAQGSDSVSSDASPDLVPDQYDEASEPLNVLEKQETLDELKTLIGDLPERSQLILSLYYVEELTLKEIADVISVSESRISQILTETATKLRTRLK